MSISPEWIAAFVVALAVAIINKLWNRASDATKSKVDGALAEMEAIMSQCVMTAKPGTTMDDVITQLKGVANLVLGRIGISVTSPMVSALVNAVIAAAVKEFVHLHPTPASLTPPILAKLAPSAIPVVAIRTGTTSVPS